MKWSELKSENKISRAEQGLFKLPSGSAKNVQKFQTVNSKVRKYEHEQLYAQLCEQVCAFLPQKINRSGHENRFARKTWEQVYAQLYEQL